MRTLIQQRAVALLAAATISVGGGVALSACSDEDGDGGTTDEEIQDVEDTVDSIQDEIEEEVDSQDRGSNRDDE